MNRENSPNSLDLYVVYLHLHADSDIFSPKYVIAIFEDKDMTKRYIEKIAIEMKNEKLKTWKRILSKSPPNLIKQNKLKDLERVEYRWNYLDEYKPYLDNEYYRNFYSYSFEHFDLNEEYTFGEINKRTFIL